MIQGLYQLVTMSDSDQGLHDPGYSDYEHSKAPGTDRNRHIPSRCGDLHHRIGK
jgi:hypothetical protein